MSDKITLKCRHCGATMEVDPDKSVLTCPYCGSKELIPESDTVKIARMKKATEEHKIDANERAIQRSQALAKKILVVCAIVLVFILIWAFTAYDSSSSSAKATAKPVETKAAEKVTAAPTEDDGKDLVAAVKDAIKDQVGINEKITDVTFRDGVLTVKVDFTKAIAAKVTKDQLAISRVGSITDKIFELDDYYDDWNTIVVDFGDTGKVTLDKSMVVDKKGVGKYFTGYDENSLVK